MKAALIIILILFALNMDAQTPEVMLTGKHTFEDLQTDTNYAWFDKNAAAADPMTCPVCDDIAAIKKPYKLIIVGGTWCSDTQDLLPKFYITSLYAAMDVNKVVELYFVDRDKKNPADIVSKYAITNVPVFIVLDAKGNEVGRITESVKVSIADDLLEILKKL